MTKNTLFYVLLLDFYQNFNRMSEREMLKVIKSLNVGIRVKSFVEAIINVVCEFKITSGSKKIVQKFHGDPAFR